VLEVQREVQVSDAEKIEKVKALIAPWALDDDQGGGDAITVLAEIMDVLEFDPWAEAAATTASGG
jgi:hypothetical protein